ncbi:MAG: transcription termination/antitermination protein NusG [Bacteroidales bacterium]
MILEKTNNWYALKTRPHKEEHVMIELDDKKFTAYLPRIWKYKSAKKRQKKLLIPGYVLVKANWKDFEQLRYIRGSKGLLSINGIPGKITEKEMDFLKKVCGESGYEPELGNYHPGDSIKILTGPLKGRKAVVASTDKHKIGVDLCQGSFRVWINAKHTMLECI